MTSTTSAVVAGVGVVNRTLYVIGTSVLDRVDVAFVRGKLRVTTSLAVGTPSHRTGRPDVVEIGGSTVDRIAVVVPVRDRYVVIHPNLPVKAAVQYFDTGSQPAGKTALEKAIAHWLADKRHRACGRTVMAIIDMKSSAY